MDGFLANGQRVYDQNDKRMFHWEAKDEYGVYRNEHGYARAVDGRAILVSKEDIRAIVERATLHEHSYICLLKHAEGYTTSIPESDTYNKQKLIEWFMESTKLMLLWMIMSPRGSMTSISHSAAV